MESQQGEFSDMKQSKHAVRGRPAMFPDLEKQLAEWINEKRKEGISVSTTVIQALKARMIQYRLRETCHRGSRARRDRDCYSSDRDRA